MLNNDDDDNDDPIELQSSFKDRMIEMSRHRLSSHITIFVVKNRFDGLVCLRFVVVVAYKI